MSTVHCHLPKAGLGNQLFPLLKASCFARLNGFNLVVTGYNRIQLGPYLRGEKTKRDYSGYFVFEKPKILEWLDKMKVCGIKFDRVVNEPRLKDPWSDKDDNILFRFHVIPSYIDYFGDLRYFRELARDEFRNLVASQFFSKVDRQPAPVIGVHIRMGDFRKLGNGEDFAKVGAVRTPENYFVEAIIAIRSIYGADLPVTIFSDGYKSELKSIFKLGRVNLIEGNRDIEDLILLSKSKLIITSAGSTFSYWAGFLSDAPIIMHPMHIHAPIRQESGLFEGIISKDPLLVENIKSIVL